MHSATSTATPIAPPLTTFSRVVVGIDGSPEALEAARQAAILADGTLTLLCAYDIASSLIGGTGMNVPAYYDEAEQRRTAGEALDKARQALAGLAAPVGKMVRGTPWDGLIGELERQRATLVALGSHGTGRALGIVIGSTTTELVHKAPCSVLVARHAGVTFPRRVVVGVDGSPQSAAAYATARELGERFGARLWPVVAHGGKGVDRSEVEKIVDNYHEDLPDDPVRALVAAAVEADLLVVGSRGLHGLKALGSVSERVAHQAGCSVLVVRSA